MCQTLKEKVLLVI